MHRTVTRLVVLCGDHPAHCFKRRFRFSLPPLRSFNFVPKLNPLRFAPSAVDRTSVISVPISEALIPSSAHLLLV